MVRLALLWISKGNLVIVKCEKYIKNHQSEELKDKFIKCCRMLLDSPHLTSYYIPIQTLGCVEFSRIDEDTNGEKHMIFKVTNKFDYEKCVNIYQPLLFVMSELFEKLKDKRNIWQKLTGWFRKFFNMKDDFKDYADKLTKISKEAKDLYKYDKNTKQMVKQERFKF